MLPRTFTGDNSPIIVEKSDTDIEGVCTGTDVAKVREDNGAFSDDGWVRPIDHLELKSIILDTE